MTYSICHNNVNSGQEGWNERVRSKNTEVELKYVDGKIACNKVLSAAFRLSSANFYSFAVRRNPVNVKKRS